MDWKGFRRKCLLNALLLNTLENATEQEKARAEWLAKYANVQHAKGHKARHKRERQNVKRARAVAR